MNPTRVRLNFDCDQNITTPGRRKPTQAGEKKNEHIGRECSEKYIPSAYKTASSAYV